MLWKLNVLPAPSKHAVTVLQASSMLLVPVLSWWCPVAAQKGEVLHRVRLPPRFSLSDGSHCGAEFLELDLWLVPCGLQVFLPLERGGAEGVSLPCFSVSRASATSGCRWSGWLWCCWALWAAVSEVGHCFLGAARGLAGCLWDYLGYFWFSATEKCEHLFRRPA